MTLAAITMTAPEAASPVQMYRATYSPDDNKLRLYAASRLDPETYKKVHDAGFRWAPKQALFVAPAWTPGREDVLLSLAGEIVDEDSTLAERQEVRAERFTGYSGKRASESAQALDEVERLAAMIPPGQNGIAWCCSASSRKWQVNICARVRRSTSKVSFAPVAGKITVSPVTSLKFLLRPRAPCRCWDVHHSRTLRRNRSLSRMGSHRVLTRRKKVARKQKAVGVRPRSRSLSRNRRRVTITGFQMISRSERLTVTTAPSSAGHHRRDENERIFQNISGAA